MARGRVRAIHRVISGNRDFRALWLGQAISGLGTWINYVGLNLYVYELSGSGRVLAFFLILRLLPALLFGPVGGHLADRYSRKTLMVACDVARALLVLGFALTRDLNLLFALGFVVSAVDKVFAAAWAAALPNVVSEDELMSANAVTRMTRTLTTVLGPAFGGLLVANYAIESVFLIDSATFVVSAVTILLVRAAMRSSPDESSNAAGNFRAALVFLRGRALLLFVCAVRLLDALGSGGFNTALPVYSGSIESVGRSSYGWLVGAWAGGSFVGSLLANASRRLRLAEEQSLSLSVLIMAIGMGLLFHFDHLALAMTAIFVGGVGDGIGSVLFDTVIMRETPDAMRGRIVGTVSALVMGTLALGMAVAGGLLDVIQIPMVTDAAALFIAVSVVIGYILYRATHGRSAVD